MDNFHLKIRADGGFREVFRMAFSLRGHPATWYSQTPSALTFYWSEPTDLPKDTAHPLPITMDVDVATDIAARWLADAKPQGKKPDTDGDVGEAWQIDSGERWGHAGGSCYGILTVSPCWAVYGK